MKKFLFTLTAILVFSLGRGQSFEGTITYKMTMKVTDLAGRRDIAEAKKAVNDPRMKPKLDKLRQDLKDPEFVKGLETNPALNAEVRRLSTLMSTASFEEDLSGNITVMLKGQRSNVILQTGAVNKQGILYQGDKKVSYSIDYGKKQFSLNDPLPPDSTRKIKKTSDTETILGHLCTKYEVINRTGVAGPTITYVWTTTEIEDIDLSKTVGGSIGAGSPLVFDVGDGVPLKIQRVMSHGTLTTEIVSIGKGNLAASDFEIPAGYTEARP